MEYPKDYNVYLDEEYLKVCSVNSTWLNKLA